MRLADRDLEIIGASIYLCEGTKERVVKRPNGQKQKIFAVEFTNIDPRVISLFLRFLRKIIKADEKRIKAELFIYPDHNEDKLIKFWANSTGIAIDRFNKTIQLEQKNFKYKPNPLGTLKIRYSHKKHFLKIQSIIKKIFGSEKKFKII
ncbi:MAG: hypothetical protein Q7R31_01830 [Candidatus Levybacteria bacterium]|nr:hypothetical protein [Candidatus Levybacteria bacterium]